MQKMVVVFAVCSQSAETLSELIILNKKLMLRKWKGGIRSLASCGKFF